MAAGGKAGHLLAVACAIAAEKVKGQERNIFAPIAQRGNVDLNRIDAEEQIFTEVAVAGFFLQIGIGGGEDADIDLASLRGTSTFEFAGFENTEQFGLLGESGRWQFRRGRAFRH